MITFVFSLDDLVRTRFAISPMWELVSAIRSMRLPSGAALHLPWVREALPVAKEIGLELSLPLTPPEGYIPDFITPPPSGPLASFEEELELVRRTSAATIRKDIASLQDAHADDVPSEREVEVRNRYLEHPRRQVDALCDELAEFWRVALEPHWDRVHAVLEEDLRYRARRLTEGGPARLFDDLSPDVAWVGDRIELQAVFETTVELRGQGLLLVPSAFQSVRPAAIAGEPWQSTLLYPSRGLALLWEPVAAKGPDALADLLGRTRADLLGALDRPRSTSELARVLEITPGGVSQHLAVLRRTGLVAGERSGRSKLYLRTAAADRLLEAAPEPARPE